MLKIVTSAQMREMDRKTIEELGIPGVVLMENAGTGVSQLVNSMAQAQPHRVYVLCGKGNNGGDGYVIARHLWDSGYSVCIIVIGEEKEIKGDAKINFEVVKKLGIEYHFASSVRDLKKCTREEPDLIIDALLGTGITGAVHGFMKEAIEYINKFDCPVVSVDIPSGLNADLPVAEGEAVRADATVTMALPKRCHIFFPSRSFVGNLHIVDIGIPNSIKNSETVKMQLVEKSDVNLPVRASDTHKYQCGKVAVLAGSPGYTGAASLTCEAALRIGAGLIILGIPGILNPILENKLTEVITKPYHSGKSSYLVSSDDPEIQDLLDWCDVLAIGPGLGRSEETQQSIIEILEKFGKPAVIDADALFALANHPGSLTNPHPNWILTPHHGEFYRLLENIDKHDFKKNYISLAQEFASQRQLVMLLKGAPSLVAAPDGQIYVNSTGNPGLASGGTGDVLTGFVAGLMVQGLKPVDASIAANFLHGLCADELIERTTEYSLTAGDLVDNIGKILKKNFLQEGSE